MTGTNVVVPAVPQTGLPSNGLRQLLSVLGVQWRSSLAGGQSGVVGHVSRVKRIGEILKDACGEVVVRHRPRLGKALGVGVSVAMCVVTVTALANLMKIKASIYQDGTWVQGLTEHAKLTCGYVTKTSDASGKVVEDKTHLHDDCEHGGVAAYNWKLIAHLQTYSMLRKRDASLLATLTSRAKAWQIDNEVSNDCYATFGPVSIMLAMVMSESEKQAARMLGMECWTATKRNFGEGIHDNSRYNSMLHAFAAAGWTGLWEHVTASGEGLRR